MTAGDSHIDPHSQHRLSDQVLANTNNSKRQAARSLDRDPTSELHQGQRSDAPHQRAGHMTAPDHFAEAQLNILRRRGASTYEFRTIRSVLNLELAGTGYTNTNNVAP